MDQENNHTVSTVKWSKYKVRCILLKNMQIPKGWYVSELNICLSSPFVSPVPVPAQLIYQHISSTSKVLLKVAIIVIEYLFKVIGSSRL